jgi:hypothetical protein
VSAKADRFDGQPAAEHATTFRTAVGISGVTRTAGCDEAIPGMVDRLLDVSSG